MVTVKPIITIEPGQYGDVRGYLVEYNYRFNLFFQEKDLKLTWADDTKYGLQIIWETPKELKEWTAGSKKEVYRQALAGVKAFRADPVKYRRQQKENLARVKKAEAERELLIELQKKSMPLPPAKKRTAKRRS